MGGLTITAIFSGFYYFASGRFLFFEHSVRSVFYISKSSTLLPLLKYMYFPMEPYWLILPILFFISFCLLLALKKLNLKDRTNVIKIILLIQFCLTFGFLVFWHIFFQPYLRIFLYMSYVIPSTFLLFGALISNPLEKLTDRQFYFVSAGSIAVFLAPLGLSLSNQYFDNFLRIQDNAILLVSAILVLISSLLLRNRFSVFFASAAIAAIGFISGADANVYVQDRWKGQENFVAVAKAVNAINEVYPDNDQKLKVMYDNLNFDIPAVAIGGIYLDLSGHGYKENDPVGWDVITSLNNKTTVLISQKGNAYNRLLKQFSAYSETVKFKLREDIPIESGKVRFHLFLFDTYVQKQDHLYPGETFEFNVPFDGKNFYDPEENQGVTYVWSGPDTETQMRFKLGTLEKDQKLSICVHALQPEIMDSFQLYINNVNIPTMNGSDANCPSLVTAMIPKTIVNKNSSDSTVFTFRVNKTASPYELGINADGRKLGLSFDWMRIE